MGVIAKFTILNTVTGREISNYISDDPNLKNAVFIDKPLPQEVLRAIGENKKEFIFTDAIYQIINFEDMTPKPQPEAKWDNDKNILYLLKSTDFIYGDANCPRCAKEVELITVLTQNMNDGECRLRGVMFCAECLKCFYKKKDFQDFLNKERPIIRHTSYGDIAQTFGWNGSSLLSELGYKADGTVSQRIRQSIINTIIINGFWKTTDVADFLEWLLRQRRKKCPEAATIWQDDLDWLYKNYYRKASQGAYIPLAPSLIKRR